MPPWPQPDHLPKAAPEAAATPEPESCPLHLATSGTVLPITACDSARNADSTVASQRLVCITHPFHPLSGRYFACVGERFNRYGTRLLLQVNQDTIYSVPVCWTDLAVPDAEVVIGEGRALFRVIDLIELEQLVTQLIASRRARRQNET